MELSRKTVGLIIALLVISLTGLSWVQIYLLNNALALKNRTLSRNVLSALTATVRQLESDEITDNILGAVGNRQQKQMIHWDQNQGWLADFDSCHVDSIGLPSVLPGALFQTPNRGGETMDHIIRIDMRSGPGPAPKPNTDEPCLRYETLFFANDPVGQSLGSMAVFTQSGYVADTMVTMIREEKFDLINKLVGNLSQKEKPQVIERIKMDQLGSILASRLQDVGIGIRFSYGIADARKDSLLFISNREDRDYLINSAYQARLFPMDLRAPFHNLKVYFPSERMFLLGQIWPLVTSSIVFMLIIVVCLTLTFRTIISQKRFADQIIGFINNMTHEFKTPISTVSLASEAIARPEVLNERATVLRYNQMIGDENRRMQKQVEKILQMAQLERGDFELNRDRIDCHELIDKAARSFGLLVEHRQGSLGLKLLADRHHVTGDSLHLTNAIGNLLDNAIKYSPGAPRIVIETNNSDGAIVIGVRDQGIGIGPADKAKVFDKYFRCSTGDRHDVKGFGLGLSYVKLIVGEHGGRALIESQPGEGTQVTISLPTT